MKVIEPSTEILVFPDIRILELAGRVCYKSEDKITDTSHEPFIEHLMNMHHESVIEHCSASVRFICDRGVSHELVRHRLASFSQESTRYCNYSKDKFDAQITVIDPSDAFPAMKEPSPNGGPTRYENWMDACECAEIAYFANLAKGATPQEARSVLPNSLKTELVVTANMREWRHIFKMRAAKSAHPQMQQLMRPLLAEFTERAPCLFNDLKESLL